MCYMIFSLFGINELTFFKILLWTNTNTKTLSGLPIVKLKNKSISYLQIKDTFVELEQRKPEYLKELDRELEPKGNMDRIDVDELYHKICKIEHLKDRKCAQNQDTKRTLEHN